MGTGRFDTHERLVREITNNAKITIVFVNYTLSPEAKYPIAPEQAYPATKWVAQNSKSINVDPSRTAVLGDSVGGNLTTALTLLLSKKFLGHIPINSRGDFNLVDDS